MTYRRALGTCLVPLLAIQTLAACAGGNESDLGVVEDGRSWVFVSADSSLRSLGMAESDLDASVSGELGIDETLELSADEAARWLPHEDATTASADGFSIGVADPQHTEAGASLNSFSLIYELVRSALDEASADSAGRGVIHPPEAESNPSLTWAVDEGSATGAFTSSTSAANSAGDSVSVVLEGQFAAGVCPDSDGVAEGAFSTTAAITFTPNGGTAKRTVLEVDVETIMHSTGQAHAGQLWSNVESAVRTGEPQTGSDNHVNKPSSVREREIAYVFEFGGSGVQGQGELIADKQSDVAFFAPVDEAAEQLSLLVARAAEDYRRHGNC